MKTYFKKNSKALIILAVLVILFILAASGMSSKDVLITSLRGFSTGSVTFLVAAGFSLIFGLMGVLNLSLGTLYMIGAYIGWTVYVRTDTFIDLITPVLLILSGFALKTLWEYLANRVQIKPRLNKLLDRKSVV